MASFSVMPSAQLHPTELEAFKMVARLATEGLGEGTKAHGVRVTVGDAKELLKLDEQGDAVYGEITNGAFDFRHLNKTIEDFKTLQAAAKEDGAIVIDRETRKLVCANFMVGNILKGEKGDGARHKAASAIAQQANGYFVVKASEDACALSTTEKPHAKLGVFNKCKASEKVLAQFVFEEESTPPPPAPDAVRVSLLCAACEVPIRLPHHRGLPHTHHRTCSSGEERFVRA